MPEKTKRDGQQVQEILNIANQKMQIKTTKGDITSHLLEWLLSKKDKKSPSARRMERKETTVGQECKLLQPL